VLNSSDQLVLFLHRMTDLTTKQYYGLFVQPIRSTTIAPLEGMNEELFISFLAGFRHFHLIQSPVEMGRIHGILRQGVKLMGNTDLLNDLETVKRRFDESPQMAADVFTSEHKPIMSLSNSREILELFLNSRYFHLDTAGLPFFFKVPHEQIVQLRNSFQWVINPYVVRLTAYVPIALKVLAASVFSSGVAKFPPERIDVTLHDERPVTNIGVSIGFPKFVLTDTDVAEINRLNATSLRKGGSD
jgi:hypothetical protein